jgi:hypothetical protein
MASTIEQMADATVTEFLRQVTREWRTMVRDPLFAHYGGVDSPERQRAYVARRVEGYRRALTEWLHRPEYLALAEALDAVSLEALE